MNNWTSPRPSMIDLGKKSKVALLAGCGGGGDIMNTIPVMNLLKKLGVEKFVLADIGCKWWSLTEKWLSEERLSISIGSSRPKGSAKTWRLSARKQRLWEAMEKANICTNL